MVLKIVRTSDDATVEDAVVLNDIVSVCRDGEKLYRYAAEQVEDQQLRNMFTEMASVRLKIARELESAVALLGTKPNRTGTMAGKISHWYVEARSHFVNYADKVFIDQLEKTEDKTLKVLRSAVQEVDDKSLMFRLSSLVALFQMSHDKMRSIQKLYQ